MLAFAADELAEHHLAQRFRRGLTGWRVPFRRRNAIEPDRLGICQNFFSRVLGSEKSRATRFVDALVMYRAFS
jgi:hypothetical protein